MDFGLQKGRYSDKFIVSAITLKGVTSIISTKLIEFMWLENERLIISHWAFGLKNQYNVWDYHAGKRTKSHENVD